MKVRQIRKFSFCQCTWAHTTSYMGSMFISLGLLMLHAAENSFTTTTTTKTKLLLFYCLSLMIFKIHHNTFKMDDLIDTLFFSFAWKVLWYTYKKYKRSFIKRNLWYVVWKNLNFDQLFTMAALRSALVIMSRSLPFCAYICVYFVTWNQQWRQTTQDVDNILIMMILEDNLRNEDNGQ